MGIYFIISSEHNLIKIGTTLYPKKRYQRLVKDNQPFSIEMVYFKDHPLTEKELHTKFNFCRKTREWFFNTEGLQEYITSNQEDCEYIKFTTSDRENTKTKIDVPYSPKPKSTYKLGTSIEELQRMLYLLNHNIF